MLAAPRAQHRPALPMSAGVMDRASATDLSGANVRRALNDGEFVLYFQPVIDLASGRPRGVEALIRWDHPIGGLLEPDDFLPAVAPTPIMASVTRWVLNAACSAAARWPDWTMAVNITARDLMTDLFTADVLAAIEASGIPAERLTLELTETALVHDLPRAATILGHLRDRGVGVALDDFGTGYSSMLYLRGLPVTSVKIDRLFIAGLDRDGDDRAIVTSLLTLARAVGLTAVAEGVETDAQARLLHALGCPLAQGFLWAPPLSENDADTVYRQGLPEAGMRRQRRQRRQPPDPQLVERVHEMLSDGASLHTIAAALNAAGQRTDRGSRWHAATVARLINSIRSEPGDG